MDIPTRSTNLRSSTDIKDMISSLQSLCQQQRHRKNPSQSKPIQYDEQDHINQQLKSENEQLREQVRYLKDRVEFLEEKLNAYNNNNNNNSNQMQEEPSQPVTELDEDEQSLQFAFMLQQQEQMEFQNRLAMLSNNVDPDAMSYEELQELQNKMGFVSRGYPAQVIQSIMKECKLDKPCDDCCTICLEDSEQPIEIRLPCNHVFHQNCLEEWLSMEKQCPVCKREIQVRQ